MRICTSMVLCRSDGEISAARGERKKNPPLFPYIMILDVIDSQKLLRSAQREGNSIGKYSSDPNRMQIIEVMGPKNPFLDIGVLSVDSLVTRIHEEERDKLVKYTETQN